MSLSVKFLLPLFAVVAFGVTGCEKSAEAPVDPAAPAASVDPVVETTVVVTETESAPIDSATPAGEPAAAPAPVNPLAEMAKNINPEQISKGIQDNFGKVEELVNGITDAASATAALPTFENVRSQLSLVRTIAPHIPGDVRPILIEKIDEVMVPLQGAIDKLYENEEVKVIVQSRVEGIKKRLLDIQEILAQPAPETEETATEETGTEESSEEPAAEPSILEVDEISAE